MLREGFCTSCMRSVYRAPDDDDACPVCSSALVFRDVAAVPPGEASPGSDLAVSEEESRRLAAVSRYDILDSPPDGAFDRVTWLAARIFNVPVATITIVDQDRIWFKSKYGIEATEIGRDPGLCASAVLQYEPLVVTDAAADPTTLENPLVRGELGLRFYAGAPLTTADGYNLGTLNIIDTTPRSLREDQVELLRGLAEVVVDELELRLASRRLYRTAAEQGVKLKSPVTLGS